MLRFLTVSALTCLFAGAPCAKVNVVTTATDFAAIAQQIGGDAVQVTALATANDDLHYVDARPSFLVPLSRADLVIVNGMELEDGWLPGLLTNARNAKIQKGATGHLDASSALHQRLDVPVGSVDRGMGDVHAAGNPHYSNDPRNGLLVGKVIAARLSLLDPDNAAGYAKRHAAFAAELGQFTRAQNGRFAALPAEQRQVVTYHKNWTYVADWLGLSVIEQLEAKPGVPPSAAQLLRVVKSMKSNGAKVILMAGYYPRTAAQRVANMTRSQLVAVTYWTRFAANETYLQRVKRATDKLYAALSR